MSDIVNNFKKREDPPLVSFRLTNPITYIKAWWKKVMANEGLDFRFRIHPVTAVLITSIIAAFAFGIGRASVFAYFPFLNNLIPTPVPSITLQANSDWVDTALSGKLQLTPNTNKYYLVTTSSATAVSLQFDESVDLSKYIGKRILATGSYNSKNHILIISDVLSLEVLPQSPVPVVTPSPSPTIAPTASPVESPISTFQ